MPLPYSPKDEDVRVLFLWCLYVRTERSDRVSRKSHGHPSVHHGGLLEQQGPSNRLGH